MALGARDTVLAALTTAPEDQAGLVRRGEGLHRLHRDAVNTTLNSIAIFGSLASVSQHWLTGSSRISQRRIVEHASRVIEALMHVNCSPAPRA